MVKVAPSMLSCDFSRLGEEVRRVDACGADWIHFDVMDGVFVPNLTFGAPIVKSVRKLSDLPFDVHLMITDPVRYIDDFADAGADLLTVHAEAGGDIPAAMERIRERGVRAGIALDPATPMAEIEPYLDRADLVLVMSVKAGFGGQKFIPGTLHKIESAAGRRGRGAGYEVSVDGGIDRARAADCVGAGADVLVAGSSLFGSADMAAEIGEWHAIGKCDRWG